MRKGTINETDCGNCKHWIPWTDDDWQRYCYNHYTAAGWNIPSKRYDFGWCDKVKAGTLFGDGCKYSYNGYSFADENYDEDLHCFEPKDVEALIWNFPDAITRCCECANWDSESGLTARECSEWCKYTTQYEFCARGKKRG